MNGALHDVSRLAADDIQVGAECDDGGPGGVKESFQHP
jgi:hypothetical protein